MRKLILFTFLIFSINCIRANSISITFDSPTPSQAMDSDLVIKANINSTFQLTTIIADIEGRQTNMVWNGLQYVGNINLAGLQQGVPLTLTITATDGFNTQQSASVNIIYAPLPTVNVSYPIERSNIYPSFRLKATANSIDPNCRIKFYIGSVSSPYYEVLLNNPVDTVITLPASSPASMMELHIEGLDAWNQTGGKSFWVYYDNNIYLSEIYRAEGAILDFNYNKVLSGAGSTGKIKDLTTSTETTLAGANFNGVDIGILNPYGAIYYKKSSAPTDSIYEWSNNSIYPLALSYPYSAVHSSGQWATFPGPGGLTRRNLVTHTNDWTKPFIAGDITWMNDVDSSGTVVYPALDNLMKYKNNLLAPLGANDGYNVYYPKIDRDYTVYLKRYDGSNNSRIYLHDGNSALLLSDLGYDLYLSAFYDNYGFIYFQTKNRYTAYLKPSPTSELQVWLRDPSGTSSQRSFFSYSSQIELLNPAGAIMYDCYDPALPSATSRFLAKPGPLQPPVSYGAAFGKLYYSDSSWYVVQGPILYRLLVDAYRSVADGNWNDPATWSNGIVPPPNADVIILNNVTVNVNATCNTLNIHSPGNITVAPGINFIILH